MTDSARRLNTHGLGNTDRKDAWWLEPLLMTVGLLIPGLYALWAVLQGNFYEWGPYLSPLYSPKLHFDWWSFSPALLIFWAPIGFRGSCYYWRKVYYRSFFVDPPSCAVGEPRGGSYKGETAFPWVFQNVHRFFFYIAVVAVLGHLWEALISLNHGGQFGFGLGNVFLLLSAVSLALYTFSCHSFRHLLGGKLDCFSCSAMNQVRHKAWSRQSWLNEFHGPFGWVSLYLVCLADLYVRLLAMGTIQDVRFF